MTAPINLDAIRQRGLARRRTRRGVRQPLPQVEQVPTREALAQADFVRGEVIDKQGTHCTNCIFSDGKKRKDRDGTCIYNDEVDLRGLPIFHGSCCAYWDNPHVRRAWKGEDAIRRNLTSKDGSSFFAECDRDKGGHCKPEGESDNSGHKEQNGKEPVKSGDKTKFIGQAVGAAEHAHADKISHSVASWVGGAA